MVNEGQIMRLPLGQFKYGKWLLTKQGRDVLNSKPQVRRRSLPRIHAKEDA
jgi:hypothetical protein